MPEGPKPRPHWPPARRLETHPHQVNNPTRNPWAVCHLHLRPSPIENQISVPSASISGSLPSCVPAPAPILTATSHRANTTASYGSGLPVAPTDQNPKIEILLNTISPQLRSFTTTSAVFSFHERTTSSICASQFHRPWRRPLETAADCPGIIVRACRFHQFLKVTKGY